MASLSFFKILAVLAFGVGVALASKGAKAAECVKIDRALFTHAQINRPMENYLRAEFPCLNGAKGHEGEGCEDFVGAALDRLWALPHFWLPEKERYASDNEIAAMTPKQLEARGWRLLGGASEADALAQAANEALYGAPVIAIGEGRAALILPGGRARSKSWNAQAPRAAMGDKDPERGFIGCRLSWVWGPRESRNVALYTW